MTRENYTIIQSTLETQNLSKTTDTKKLKKAAEDFESYFVKQLLTEMRKTTHMNTEDKNNNVRDIYDSMIDDELSKGIVKSGSFGLAKQLFTNMQKVAEHYHATKNMETTAEIKN